MPRSLETCYSGADHRLCASLPQNSQSARSLWRRVGAGAQEMPSLETSIVATRGLFD